MCLKKITVRTINKRKKAETAEEFIQGYPSVMAHLVAESLGYFRPESEAKAVLTASMAGRTGTSLSTPDRAGL